MPWPGPNNLSPWDVYVLRDPRTREVRYVGWTNNRTKRLRRHINDAVRINKSYAHRWIRSILDAEHKPIMEIVESGVGPGWGESERKWIWALRTLGARLTNLTDGGGGALGHVKSEEMKRSIGARTRARMMALSPQQRSEKAKEIWASITQEHRDKFLANGLHSKSPEIRSQVAKDREATLGEEKRSQRARDREAAIGASHRSEISKRTWSNVTLERRREMLAKLHTGVTKEQRQERSRKAEISRKPGERSVISRKIWESRTPEQKADLNKKRWEGKTPEQRSESAKRGAATLKARREARN